MGKFKVGQKICHYNGNVYVITMEPDESKRLENGNVTFYAYKNFFIPPHNFPEFEWYRRSDEVEDGRFELVAE